VNALLLENTQKAGETTTMLQAMEMLKLDYAVRIEKKIYCYLSFDD